MPVVFTGATAVHPAAVATIIGPSALRAGMTHEKDENQDEQNRKNDQDRE
jgi:hypothetical protein